ncbi:MAG: hypothetical protein ACLGIF_11390 [Actinomycetes bacterium]
MAEVVRAQDSVTLRVSVTGDGYAQFARRRYRLVLHGAQPERVLLDGDDLAVTEGAVVRARAAESFTVGFAA